MLTNYLAAWYFLLVGVLRQQNTAFANFIEPPADTRALANQSDTVIIKWKYTLSSSFSQVFCGYSRTVSDFPIMIYKNRDSALVQINTKEKGFPDEFANRVSVPQLKDDEIGMEISGLKESDRKGYFCKLIVDGQLGYQSSRVITLDILERPKIDNCLLNTLKGIEGDRLTTECNSTGKPPPHVTCFVIGTYSDEKLLKSLPATDATLNYVIDPLMRYYDRIVCEADGREAGVTRKSRSISVLYPPSMPLNVRVTAVTNSTMTLAWDPPEDNGGLTILSYEIQYTTGGITLQKNLTNPAMVSKRVTTLIGLTAKKKYSLAVIAHNKAGRGNVSESIVMVADYRDPSSGESSINDNTLLLISIIVPSVVVVLVTLIILYFVCCRNKRGKENSEGDYAANYVESASEYASSKASKDDQEDCPLYSSVNKQKPHSNGTAKTNGLGPSYPDIVKQANGIHKLPYYRTSVIFEEPEPEPEDDFAEMPLRRYEDREKDPFDQDYMSPSYETSTKEYV